MTVTLELTVLLGVAGVVTLAIIAWVLCRMHGTLDNIADALYRMVSDEETEE